MTLARTLTGSVTCSTPCFVHAAFRISLLSCFVCCLCSADGMFANANMSSVMSSKSRPGNKSRKHIKKQPGKSGSRRSKTPQISGYERYKGLENIKASPEEKSSIHKYRKIAIVIVFLPSSLSSLLSSSVSAQTAHQELLRHHADGHTPGGMRGHELPS